MRLWNKCGRKNACPGKSLHPSLAAVPPKLQTAGFGDRWSAAAPGCSDERSRLPQPVSGAGRRNGGPLAGPGATRRGASLPAPAASSVSSSSLLSLLTVLDELDEVRNRLVQADSVKHHRFEVSVLEGPHQPDRDHHSRGHVPLGPANVPLTSR